MLQWSPHMPSLPPPKSNVVPINAGQLNVRRRPGRPRKVRVAPDHDELNYAAKIAKMADTFIAADPIVKATEGGERAELGRIDAVLRGLAEEQAGLLWDRQRLQREGRGNPAQVSSRRVDALLKLAGLVVVRERLRAVDPEPDPEDVAKIVAMLVQEVEETVAAAIPAEVGARFVAKLKEKIAAANMPCRRTP